MKYMTFNSSCAFAGIANMLAKKGISVEDYEVALGMELPYLMVREGGSFLAGTMLQEKKWFDIFLKKQGFELSEKSLKKEEVPGYLEKTDTAMLGLRIDENKKHAVVFKSIEEEIYFFLNNKHEGSEELDELCLTREELLERLDEEVMVATLLPCAKETVDVMPMIHDSMLKLDELQYAILDFCEEEHSREEVLENLDRLFRPVLLEGVSMMELLHEEEVAAQLREVREAFMQVVFREQKESVRLDECIGLVDLSQAIMGWKSVMRDRLEQLIAEHF
ncbi:MAG: hypothetical protein E7280_05965 [Lachnospiraceae bacterium]|nr:hypothetical protein [Lachnospiraceae bacterium]